MNDTFTRWMWVPGWESKADRKADKAEFIREFSVSREELSPDPDEKSAGCKVKISADSKYKLFVNDAFVCYGPARGDREIWYFDEPDILPYLHEGNNIIRVEVLYYLHCGTNSNFGIAHGPYPGLFFDAESCGIEDLKDGTESVPGISENGELLRWKCRIIPGFNVVRESPGFAPLIIMENNSAEAFSAEENRDYRLPVLYTVWQISNEVSPGNLNPRPIPFMYLKRKDLFKKTGDSVFCAGGAGADAMAEGFCVKAHETRKIVFDAGEEETGFIFVRLSGKADIKLLYSECYYLTDEAGNSYKADRTDSKNGHLEGFTDNCCSTAEYSPFWYRTFRYIEFTVTAGNEDVDLEELFYYETGYPLTVKHQYTGNDEYKKKIWDISLRTLKRCMQETYIDCPFYEQLQYVMDTRNQMVYTYAVAEDDRLAREAIRSFARSQRYDGLLNAAYPSSASNVIPGFSIYFILMVDDHLKAFGDRKFAASFLGTIDGILGFFENHINAQGLVGKTGGLNNPIDRFWSFIDWTKEWDPTTGIPAAILSGPITMESLLYIFGLQSAVQINETLGRHDIAAEYRERAENVRKAIRACCIDDKGMVMDGPGVDIISQHCQVFSILCDVLPLETAAKNLEETLQNPAKYAQCSVAMLFYLFRALEKTGLYNKYFEEKMAIYRWMVDMHLTTCVEDNVGQRSDCHAWAAVSLYEYLNDHN